MKKIIFFLSCIITFLILIGCSTPTNKEYKPVEKPTEKPKEPAKISVFYTSSDGKLFVGLSKYVNTKPDEFILSTSTYNNLSMTRLDNWHFISRDRKLLEILEITKYTMKVNFDNNSITLYNHAYPELKPNIPDEKPTLEKQIIETWSWEHKRKNGRKETLYVSKLNGAIHDFKMASDEGYFLKEDNYGYSVYIRHIYTNEDIKYANTVYKKEIKYINK